MKAIVCTKCGNLHAPYIAMTLAVILLSPVVLSPAGVVAPPARSFSSVNLGTVPRGVAVDPAHDLIYVVLYLNGTTLELDARTLVTTAKIATPSPYTVAADPSSGRAYVSQGEGASITVISGAKAISSITGAGTPYALEVDPTTHTILAADTADNKLWVINGSSDTVMGSVPTGDTSAVAVDSSAGYAFIGSPSSGPETSTVGVLDLCNESIVRTVQLSFAVGHFAFDPASRLLFVTAADIPSSGLDFAAIDDRTFQTVYSIHLGSSLGVMTVDGSSNVYVSDVGANRLYEVDGRTGTVELNSTGDPAKGISAAGITAMALDTKTGDLYINERDVTSLIVLSANTVGSGSTNELPYAYVATLAVVAVVASALVIVITRRRTATARRLLKQTEQ